MKLEAARKLLSALENITTNSSGEAVKQRLVHAVIGLKVKPGLGISNLPLDEILGLGLENKYPSEEAAQIARELHHPITRHFPTRKVICYGKDQLFTSDLREMKPCDGCRCILIVMYVYTRFLWTILLADRGGETITNALRKLFEQTKRIPILLWCDEGRIFQQNFSTIPRLLWRKTIPYIL